MSEKTLGDTFRRVVGGDKRVLEEVAKALPERDLGRHNAVGEVVDDLRKAGHDDLAVRLLAGACVEVEVAREDISRAVEYFVSFFPDGVLSGEEKSDADAWEMGSRRLFSETPEGYHSFTAHAARWIALALKSDHHPVAVLSHAAEELAAMSYHRYAEGIWGTAVRVEGSTQMAEMLAVWDLYVVLTGGVPPERGTPYRRK